MSALLRIAPELRDMILQHVLFESPREPPTDPSASLHRTRRRYSEDAKCSDGHDIWVEPQPFFSAAATATASSSSTSTSSSSSSSLSSRVPSLLLVNRQLYHEAAGILARRRLHYRLDVMYVKECGLWPTWLDLPRPSRRVEEVHATFRVFDPPADVNPDWRNPRQLVTGDGGPPMVVWNFFALLKDYLRYGPSAFEALVARPAPSSAEPFTLARLVLDVLPPAPGSPAARDDSLGFPRSRLAADRHMLDAFARGRHAKYWPLPPDAFPHLMVAEKMAFFIAAKIAGLLAMYDDYGRCLYEHVGTIEVRVAGHPRRTFDLDELMGMLPPTPIQAHSPAATARKQKAFDEWKAATMTRRAAWR